MGGWDQAWPVGCWGARVRGIAYPRLAGAAPSRWRVTARRRVRVALSIVVVDPPDGEAQRGGDPPLAREVHVGAAVSQQPQDFGVVILRRHNRRRGAARVRVVHGSVRRALEYNHPYDLRVPAPSRRYERRILVDRSLEARPAQVARLPPAGRSLLTAAVSPAAHASNSAWALMFGMILPLGSRGAERVNEGRTNGGARGGLRAIGWFIARSLRGSLAGHPLSLFADYRAHDPSQSGKGSAAVWTTDFEFSASDEARGVIGRRTTPVRTVSHDSNIAVRITIMQCACPE